MLNNIKLFEERFIETITEKETEKYSYGSFDRCPYCNRELDSNRKNKDRKYKQINFETETKDSVYLKCLSCHVSFTSYKPKQVPYFNISLAVLLKILFAPHLSVYRLNCITDVNRSSIKRIREIYSSLSDALCSFVRAFDIKDFTEFEKCYENADMLKTFEDSTGVIMPTQENALWWLYNYLFVKKKGERNS